MTSTWWVAYSWACQLNWVLVYKATLQHKSTMQQKTVAKCVLQNNFAALALLALTVSHMPAACVHMADYARVRVCHGELAACSNERVHTDSWCRCCAPRGEFPGTQRGQGGSACARANCYGGVLWCACIQRGAVKHDSNANTTNGLQKAAENGLKCEFGSFCIWIKASDSTTN